MSTPFPDLVGLQFHATVSHSAGAILWNDAANYVAVLNPISSPSISGNYGIIEKATLDD